MGNKATLSSKAALWKLCQAFIAEQQISCAEAVYDSDRVAENAYEFIAGVCEIVGFHDYGEDDA